MTKGAFLKDVNNFSNHRFLLWQALEATKHLGLPILELGCGFGSTPYLKEYAKDNNLELFSYDYDKEWADRFGAVHVTNWDTAVDWSKEYSVVLVDESPGDHRRISINALTNAVIQVVHDSEIEGWNSSDYKVRPLFSKFRYTYDLKSEYHGGAWASALSNSIDVTKFIG